jgi:hypothetical protein
VIEYLSHIFLEAPAGSGSDYFLSYLWNTLVMLALCGLGAFVLTCVLLGIVGAYRRSAETIQFIDNDTRVKMCMGWAALIVLLAFGSAIFWIRWHFRLPGQPGILTILDFFACHLSVLVAVALIWLLIYVSIRHDLKLGIRAANTK